MAAEVTKRAGFALLIGIGDYLHSDQISGLQFATRDAKAMARALADPEVCGFPAERVVLLTDKRARRSRIVQHLSKWLPAQANGADIVVIYFAGHGMVQKVGPREEGFLLPYDADPEDLVTRGVAMGDVARWIEGIDARAVVVCLDCCHSGKVIPRQGLSGSSIARNIGIRPAVLQAIAGKGRFLITSCDEGQYSLESPQLKHGLFTYHLLRGIAGSGDQDRDGKVGVAELFEYVGTAVEKDSREMFGLEQKPWNTSTATAGVYISCPKAPPERSPEVAAIEEIWDDKGSTVAIAEIEQRIRTADEPVLLGILRMLRRKADPGSIPSIFGCLAHRSEAVRERARRAVHTLGWEKTAAGIEDLARRSDDTQVGFVLEGLAAFEAHADVVSLLDRLVGILKGNLRNRAIRLLERKRLGLEQEKVASLFREIRCPYQIQKVLGQGLFTAAYLAHDEEMDLQVVVRILRPEFISQPHIRAHFLDLSKKSIRLVHQNLVRTLEAKAFPDRNVYYTVRDYVAGVTLQEVLESGKRFEPPQVIKLLRQVLEALAPLHREGTFHGGIEPSNVFLCKDDRVVLGDPSLPLQGIVAALQRLAYDYRYAPPEMFGGEGSLGPQSDFYAFGCMAYELFCGAPPFVSDNHHQLIIKHVQEPFVPPSQRSSGLGVAGDQFLGRLLAKTPTDRFGKLEEVLSALDGLLESQRPKVGQEKPPARLLKEDSLDKYEGRQSILPLIGPGRSDVIWLSELGTGRLPKQVSGYEILEILGRGGMGVVYKARDLALKRLVALKMIVGGSHAGNEGVARFRREAEAVARLQHPNIVQIYEIGEQDGVPYVSLEFVDGGNLGQKLADTPSSAREAAQIVERLARAIHYAHLRGIIHRDLKPSNILLTADGTPKISDFGLAKQLDGDVVQTHSGVVMGTPAYMAPEQALGRPSLITAATDVYALGAILYELLTGKSPFKGATVFEMLEQVRSREPLPPSRLQPGLPRDLEIICLKCLQKEPDKRYQTALDLAEDLDRFLRREAIVARPVMAWERAVKWARRRPMVAALLILLVGMALLSLILGYLLASK